MVNPKQQEAVHKSSRASMALKKPKGITKHTPKALPIALEVSSQNRTGYGSNPQNLFFPTATFGNFFNDHCQTSILIASRSYHNTHD